jgi:hypothetical protein
VAIYSENLPRYSEFFRDFGMEKIVLPPVDKDPDPERRGLRTINDAGVSVFAIKAAAVEAKTPLTMSIDALHRFLSGKTLSPRVKNRQSVREFLDTKEARELLVVPTEESLSFDRLSQYLSNGNPTIRKLEGTYLEFHGSYLQEKHYAIRLIAIAQSGQRLSVTDFINEDVSGLIKRHTAHGGAVLFGDPARLNVVTVAEQDDNRIGMSLFTASILEFDENAVLQSAHGHVTGLTRKGLSFQRGSRLVRVGGLLPSEQKAIEEAKTGVFEWEELGDHQKQFEILKQRMRRTDEMQTIFKDPCAPVDEVKVRKKRKRSERHKKLPKGMKQTKKSTRAKRPQKKTRPRK